MSGTKLRQQYLHAHTSYAMENLTTVTYSEMNDTLALVRKTPCNHILLELYHPEKISYKCSENTSMDFECFTQNVCSEYMQRDVKFVETSRDLNKHVGLDTCS